MKALAIEASGLLTTVQDAGRYGFQDKGVPVSGAMDRAALELGNELVGNTPGAAALEIFSGGFRARFLTEVSFTVTGFDPDVRLNGHGVDLWTPHTARAGDVVSIDAGRLGLWHYLCLAGGIDVPFVLGSRSTYLRGRFGGLEGRALRPGDVLETEPPGPSFPLESLPQNLRPAYAAHPTIRVVLGPQAEAFSPEAFDAFLGAPYVVSTRSDRMGMMLDGPRLKHRATADIVSEGVAFGAIQVPGEGLPFVLLADRPTTGGYTKIATVLSVDLPLLVQTAPGRSVRFQAVDLLEAREAHLKRAYRIRRFFHLLRHGGL
uniref:Biotin-dependent carboxyltransferase family protein n=1 Tax=Desulfacinum infernum TaxID=35837 RepID=A0A832EK29_9BACT